MRKKELTFKNLLLPAIILLTAGAAVGQDHDVAWTFSAVVFQSYRLDTVSPNGVDLGAPLGSENPTLMLQVGTRYKVTTPYSTHPFEVIAKGADQTQDTVLLSMGALTAPFELDPDVDWVDNGLGDVTFTLTFALYEAMNSPTQQPGYRCKVHTSTMRGNFTVLGAPIGGTIEKGIAVELETIASGLAAPVDLKPTNDGTGRLLVADQNGKIWVIQNDTLLGTPFLDLSGLLISPLGIIGSHDENDYDERGFLGLVLHPGFANPASPGYRKIYTYTSQPDAGSPDFTTNPPPADVNHQSVIAEWSVDPLDANKIDPNSRREIMRIDEPQFNHNAGMLAFGPDDYLYISLGDGGNADDVGDGHGAIGNGQDVNTVHGSILRIDPLDPSLTVGSPDANSANGKYRVPSDNPFVSVTGVDEIYAYGFRNPFRFGFDPVTGKLIVGDVGQNTIEEVDIVDKGGNYGWNLKEGTFSFDSSTGTVSSDLGGLPPGLIDPVAQYDHDEGIAIVGGYVYRGSAIPELFGKYVFGDFSRSFAPADGRLFYADLDTSVIKEFVLGINDHALDLYVKGMGQDSNGEVYVLADSALGPYGTSGLVLRIVDLCAERLTGDLDGDCDVDFFDQALLADDWLMNTSRL